MKKLLLIMAIMLTTTAVQARTLIVYYSYTNNVERIVGELRKQIEADVVEIEPAVKGLDYAADNYAIGSEQIASIRNNPNSDASYPAIDPTNVNLADYDCIIIGAPLWWSSMAAPLQTYLFHHGPEMAGKNIGLIVSSASSGISGVEADAKRLVPGGNFLSPNLWIRSAQTANAESLLRGWLIDIDYRNLTAGIDRIEADEAQRYTAYSLSGVRMLADAESTESLAAGAYIINGKKLSRQNEKADFHFDCSCSLITYHGTTENSTDRRAGRAGRVSPRSSPISTTTSSSERYGAVTTSFLCATAAS